MFHLRLAFLPRSVVDLFTHSGSYFHDVKSKENERETSLGSLAEDKEDKEDKEAGTRLNRRRER